MFPSEKKVQKNNVKIYTSLSIFCLCPSLSWRDWTEANWLLSSSAAGERSRIPHMARQGVNKYLMEMCNEGIKVQL